MDMAVYWKRYNSPINGPISMKLGWSHHIMSPICPPCCGCHGNGRCLATAYGRLQAERVNQFWCNFVHNSKLGPQWQSCDQILKFVKFKMADGCRVEIYWKCHISPPNGQIGTKLGWSHPTNTSTAKTFSLVLVVTANRTVNVLVLWGVEKKKSTILMKLGWLCASVLQKNKIW